MDQCRVINGVVNKKPKIEITAFYTAATAAVTDSDAGATIKIVVENRANGALLKLEHLYWIDKQDNGRLMLFNNTITFPQNINAGESQVLYSSFQVSNDTPTNQSNCISLKGVSVNSVCHSNDFRR